MDSWKLWIYFISAGQMRTLNTQNIKRTAAALFFFALESIVSTSREARKQTAICTTKNIALTRLTMCSPQLPTNYWIHSDCTQTFEVRYTVTLRAWLICCSSLFFVICRFVSFFLSCLLSLYKRYTNKYIETNHSKQTDVPNYIHIDAYNTCVYIGVVS